MSKSVNKYILPPLAPSPRSNRPFSRFHKFDVPGDSDDLNDAMIAEDTRFAESKDSQTVLMEALRIQQKLGEERREENKELRERNKELEKRLREIEEENLKLKVRLEVREDREMASRNSFERLVDKLLAAVVKTKNEQVDGNLEQQIRRLSSELLHQTLDSETRGSTTPPNEPQ